LPPLSGLFPSFTPEFFFMPVSALDPAASTAPTDAKAIELQRAFDLFNQVSAELTQAYAALQQKVASLTGELAVANGELRRQYEEKEALSERLGLLLNALPAGVVVLDGSGRITEVNPARGNCWESNWWGSTGAMWQKHSSSRR